MSWVQITASGLVSSPDRLQPGRESGRGYFLCGYSCHSHHNVVMLLYNLYWHLASSYCGVGPTETFVPLCADYQSAVAVEIQLMS